MRVERLRNGNALREPAIPRPTKVRLAMKYFYRRYLECIDFVAPLKGNVSGRMVHVMYEIFISNV